MKLFLIGFMGSGKSFLGKQVSQQLQIPFFDLDERIEEHEGKTISDIFGEKGEEYFRLLEKDILYLITESHESFVMATGGGTPCYFNNIDYLKTKGQVIWINPSIQTICNRLKSEKDKRPLVKNLPDAQLAGYIQKKMADRRIYYQQAHHIINQDDIHPEHIINSIYLLNH
jgi:shikimate kinase